LTKAGPLGLIIGIAIWSLSIFAGSNCLIEIATLIPVDGGFVTYANRYVEKSFSMALGWNVRQTLSLVLSNTNSQFVVAQLALVCFESTAINVIVEYWTDSLHPAICITATLVALALIQLYSVRWFGEIEFWISITKVLLMIGLTLYTFVTMVGGNPLKDKYGFRFWKTPGPFGVGTGLEVLRGVFDTVIWSCFAYVPLPGSRTKADGQRCRT
jgi:amino acid transporter